MRPACGSTSVFHTKAESGASAAGRRVASAFVAGSVPFASPRSAGEGRRSTIASRTAWTPTFRRDEAGRTGKTLPATTAWRSPFASCSWESVPFSKNSSMSSSLLSATISTSFSRQAFAGSCWAAGTSVDLELAARVVAVDLGLPGDEVHDAP